MLMQIDLKINHDWNPVIEKFLHIQNLLKENPDVNSKKYIEGYNSYRYDFGESGSFLFYDNITKTQKSAAVMSGKIVANHLPWVSQLKKDLEDLNLVSICIQQNTVNLESHVDGQEANISGHCKCNYILGDYTDVTYLQDTHGVIKSYPSHKDTAWLLDTTKLHWVSGNTGPRFIFQMAFHQDFETVADWFGSKGPLRY